MKIETFYLFSIIVVNSATAKLFSNIDDCECENFQLTYICGENSTIETNLRPGASIECPKPICLNFKKWGLTDGVHFKNCTWSQLPYNFFAYTANEFNTSHLGLESIHADSFINATYHLKKYDASHNKIAAIPAALFKDAKEIKFLDFSFNQINRVDPNLFPIKSPLEHLDFSFNRITELNMSFFEKLTKLKILSLQSNLIEEIPQFVFHKADNLLEIDVSFNKISKIDEFAFFGDFKLQKLNLSHNQITSLNKQVLDNHPNLRTLDISRNQILALSPGSFGNLHHLGFLNLSRNSIGMVENGTFAYLIRLQTLDLSCNKLITLDIHTLSPRPYLLELLSIGNNQLQQLNGFNKSALPNAKIEGIESNRFNCSHLNKLFQIITWKHLSLDENGYNCSESQLDIGNSTQTQSQKENKQANLTDLMHSDGGGNVINYSYIIWLNAIGLVIIILTLLWIILQMHKRKQQNSTGVFFRK